MRNYEIENTELRHTYTDQEHGHLRKNGVNALVDLDGRTFMSPGMGITTAKTSVRQRLFADQFFNTVEKLVRALKTDHMAKPLSDDTTKITLGAEYHNARLHVICKRTKKVFWSTDYIQ